jgi:preprotein translocase subunit SecD
LEIFPLIWLGVAIVAAVALALLRPNRHLAWLVITVVLISLAIWISLPNNPGIHLDLNNDGKFEIDKPIDIREGLDLAGGLQVLLQADIPAGQSPSVTSMDEARRIVSARIDALGALDPVVQQRGADRIIVELPGFSDPERATALIQQTALLEFVEVPGGIQEGSLIRTDYREKAKAAASGAATPGPNVTAASTVSPTPTAAAAGAVTPGPTPGTPAGDQTIYHTVMTGATSALRSTQTARRFLVITPVLT